MLTHCKRQYYSVGARLENLGNTCFLNSVLQCFIHTVPLLYALIAFTHKLPCSDFIEGFCLLCALRQHIQFSLFGDVGVLCSQKFTENLKYFSSYFERNQQEDAHEFLQCFLDKLESCCIDLMQKCPMSSGINFVKEVFGGRLVSSLQCCSCGHRWDTYEPSIDLSLEIDSADTLYAALDSFTKIEKLEDTKFTCEECKEQVSVQKKLKLDQAPSIATFQLKKFKSDGEKIDKYVAFPLKLDMQPYIACGQINNDAEVKYDLYAIVVHARITSWSGHYYCFIRSADHAWFKLDDSRVSHVSEEYVLSRKPYILFYAKQGTQWVSSFIETQLLAEIKQACKSTKKSTDHMPCKRKWNKDLESLEIKQARKIIKKSIHRVSCKRKFNKDLENIKVQRPCKLTKKSTPGSRGQQLIKQ